MLFNALKKICISPLAAGLDEAAGAFASSESATSGGGAAAPGLLAAVELLNILDEKGDPPAFGAGAATDPGFATTLGLNLAKRRGAAFAGAWAGASEAAAGEKGVGVIAPDLASLAKIAALSATGGTGGGVAASAAAGEGGVDGIDLAGADLLRSGKAAAA